MGATFSGSACGAWCAGSTRSGERDSARSNVPLHPVAPEINHRAVSHLLLWRALLELLVANRVQRIDFQDRIGLAVLRRHLDAGFLQPPRRPEDLVAAAGCCRIGALGVLHG